jgi:predicted site-specific integrase-resolvase
MTVRETEGLTRYTRETLRRFARDGRLVPIRVGTRSLRYRASDVERFIASRP